MARQKPSCGGGHCFGFFFLLTLLQWGLCDLIPIPPTPFGFEHSNTAVDGAQLAMTLKPQSAASEASTGADSFSKANKSLLEVFSFKAKPLCFVYTCWLFHCSPHRFVVFNTFVLCSAPLLNKHDIHVSIHDHVD